MKKTRFTFWDRSIFRLGQAGVGRTTINSVHHCSRLTHKISACPKFSTFVRGVFQAPRSDISTVACLYTFLLGSKRRKSWISPHKTFFQGKIEGKQIWEIGWLGVDTVPSRRPAHKNCDFRPVLRGHCHFSSRTDTPRGSS